MKLKLIKQKLSLIVSNTVLVSMLSKVRIHNYKSLCVMNKYSKLIINIAFDVCINCVG